MKNKYLTYRNVAQIGHFNATWTCRQGKKQGVECISKHIKMTIRRSQSEEEETISTIKKH